MPSTNPMWTDQNYAENVDDATNMDVDSQSNDNVDSNLDVDELTQHLDHTEKIFTQNFPLDTVFWMKDNLFELAVRLERSLVSFSQSTASNIWNATIAMWKSIKGRMTQTNQE